MGHRAIHKHRSRHRTHADKPANLSQGSRVVKRQVVPPVALPASAEIVLVATVPGEVSTPEIL